MKLVFAMQQDISMKPAHATGWGGYSAYFSDLDGHLWEVAHNPHFWVGPKDSAG